jgi:hypothetical protein
LTNVLKHAPGAATTVAVRYWDADIQLSVVNYSGHSDGGRPHEGGEGSSGCANAPQLLGASVSPR